MPKYTHFALILETRILRGDYTLEGLPSEQDLAVEFGISRMTVRRALLHLMEAGIIARKPYGRLTINVDHERLGGQIRIALLTPAFASGQYDSWAYAAEHAAATTGASLRIEHYLHWNAPVITQALGSFDGVFLVPSSEPMPKELIKRLAKADNLVVLDGNLAKWGIPSVQTSQAAIVQRMGDHLLELGHRTIDCINVQPHDLSIIERLQQWDLWKNVHKVQGLTFDEPVEPYAEPTVQAYSTMKRVLEKGGLKATALLAVTNAAADGAVRALHEHGLAEGRDISVCALDGARTSRFLVPSRTASENTDMTPYVEVCMRWMCAKDGAWKGPLLIEPSNLNLFIGESTIPAPKK